MSPSANPALPVQRILRFRGPPPSKGRLFPYVIAMILVAVSLIPPSGNSHPSPAPAQPSAAIARLPAAAVPSAPARTTAGGSGPGGLQCDGMYWNDSIWGNYSPAWCYGHDEPTMSFISTAPGSGENANYSLTLPADGTYAQGDLYATIWFGGVVYDPGSLGNQAFLEFQMYPSPPTVTGTGSGTQDCLPNGAFNPTYTAGSNGWFACAIVWELINCSTTCVEDAAFAGPLDLQGTTSILEFYSNDRVFVNISGVAQSTTQSLQISLTDTTLHNSGTVALTNGTKHLSPYYATAASGNTLTWGASAPGAVAVAYEIGHALNPAIPAGGAYGGCYPGDRACDSYWPGLWAQSGQLQLTLPVMGSTGSQTFPSQISYSSSAGGEGWINETTYSTCLHPNRSAAVNCIYPWYIYRGQNYSFTFGTSNLSNETHDYRNWYQFSDVSSTHFSYAAPWGTLRSTVVPTSATVEFNPLRTIHRLTVLATGAFGGQFMEGPYWLNVSAPGCTSFSAFVYLKTGALYTTPVTLRCVGYYPVKFAPVGLVTGVVWSVTFNGTTLLANDASILFSVTNGTLPYSAQSPIPGTTGARYNASNPTGSVNVTGAGVNVTVTYAVQYDVTATASPAAGGSVSPASTWVVAGGSVTVIATPNPSWAFISWVGVGNGNYTGTRSPAPITNVAGPLQETAFFGYQYTVSFVESGLPSGTSWNVTLNGQVGSSTATSFTFRMLDGTFNFSLPKTHGYSADPSSGSVSVNGSNVTVSIQFSKPVLFGLTTTELELLLVVLAAVAIAIGLAVGLSRRKKPPPPPAYPAPPPPWIAGPPPR